MRRVRDTKRQAADLETPGRRLSTYSVGFVQKAVENGNDRARKLVTKLIQFPVSR